MIVWLSSYPRSGNTFFRVILNTVFDIKTYSIHGNDVGDIGADEATAEIVGHSFLPKGFNLDKARASNEVYYIKTHELLENMVLDSRDKVIYLVRDGRESTLSLTKHLQDFFGKDNDDLSDVICGNTPFGYWGEHVNQWQSVDKLLIKFEDLIDNPSLKLRDISKYLNIKSLDNKIPTFEELQKVNPKFFRSGKKDSWKEHFSESDHLAFWLQNADEMIAMNYTDGIPKEVNNDTFQTFALIFKKENKMLVASRINEGEVVQKLNFYRKTYNRMNAENQKQQLQLNKCSAECQEKQLVIDDIYSSKKYKLASAFAAPFIKAKKIIK